MSAQGRRKTRVSGPAVVHALLSLGALAAVAWTMLGVLTPDDTVLMIGNLSDSKLRIILAAFVLSTIFVWVIWRICRAVSGRKKLTRITAAYLAILGTSAMWVALLVACLIAYGLQPDQHRFQVENDSREFLLESRIGALITADDTALDLFVRDGRLYVDTGVQFPDADTVLFETRGFDVESKADGPYLVYRSIDNQEVRVAIPGSP